MTRNDVIITSLPKTIEKCRPPQNQTIIYHSQGIDESYTKMYFLLNLSHYVKSYGHVCQILAFFTMPALQMWRCHVTQEANFEKILLLLILHLILGKAAEFLVENLSTSKVISQKTSQGAENTPPPVLLGLTVTIITWYIRII